MLRLILVFLVIVMIVRAFVITGLESRAKEPVKKPGKGSWKFKREIARELGEYVDFEEIKKKN